MINLAHGAMGVFGTSLPELDSTHCWKFGPWRYPVATSGLLPFSPLFWGKGSDSLKVNQPNSPWPPGI